jgi:hypothetical protein
LDSLDALTKKRFGDFKYWLPDNNRVNLISKKENEDLG